MTDRYTFLLNSPHVSESLFGLNLVTLQTLIKKVQKEHLSNLDKNPLSKRGLKPSISFENQVLITLEYLRTYSTFEVLAFNYGISVSYANKIYHKISVFLLEVIGLKNDKKISPKKVTTAIVDTTSQVIEKPSKEPKKYYNRYKKTILQKHNSL
jgi:hypothetical protein